MSRKRAEEGRRGRRRTWFSHEKGCSDREREREGTEKDLNKCSLNEMKERMRQNSGPEPEAERERL